MSGIRINLSSKEATSEARDTTPLPNGRYLVAVTDVDVKECGEKSKNAGKPYYAVEFTVQDGEYEGRKVWTNAMLFSGALFTIVQMLKSQNVPFHGEQFQVDGFDVNEVPEASWWMGQQMVVRTKIEKGALKEGEPKDGVRYDDKAEIKGFFPASEWKGAPAPRSAASAGVQSLMP